MRAILSLFTAIFILGSQAFADDILNFKNSKEQPETAKKIIKMIAKASPGNFVDGAENTTNRHGDLAYTLVSHSQKKEESPPRPEVTFTYTKVDTKSGLITTNPIYVGEGYYMHLTLEMSHRLLTKEGKKYFRDLAG